MLEQYKVDALREAIKALIRDVVSVTEGEDDISIHLSDTDIRLFVENLEGIIGKEHHDNK